MAAPETEGTPYDVWTAGEFSTKSSGKRSIRGFASGAADKSSCSVSKDPCIKNATDVDYKDNGFISVMNAYWLKKGLNQFTWGEQIVDAAFKGTAIGDIDFSKVGWDFRKETIGKGIVYLNVFPYVIWEMQDAINDCKAGKLSANKDSVHAWDEAVAFYTGSLEGTTQGGDVGLAGGYDEGELQFTVAEKRCKNFGTCTADSGPEKYNGYSQVNFDIFKLFARGRDEILVAVLSEDSHQQPKMAMKMKSMMKAMKAPMKAMMKKAAMKSMMKKKAMKVSKIAKGKMAKSMVFRGSKAKTTGGLTKDKLIKNKAGKVVSKKASAAAKKRSGKILKWGKAVSAARKALGIKGFCAVGGKSAKGQSLLKKVRSLYKK
jgi:hypothetical protein